jgi:hypothetical protein
MTELRVPTNSRALVVHHAGLIEGIVIDESDRASIPDVPACVAPAMMRNLEDRIGLARRCAVFATQLRAHVPQTAGGTR